MIFLPSVDVAADEKIGNNPSTARVIVLLESDPSLLKLPAASENLVDATEITPFVVLSAVGVKVAV